MISSAQIDIAQLSIKPLRSVGKLGMRMADVEYGRPAHPLTIALREATVPFEPSVYNGTGAEPRKGIVFAVSSEDVEAIARLEEACQAALKTDELHRHAVWNSCVKPGGQYPASLRAKITIPGANFFDAAGQPAGPPDSWRRLKVNAALRVKGLYETKQGSGLVLETVALQYDELDVAEPAVACPF